MDELQERQRELKAAAGRFAEVKYWMDTFKEHVRSDEKMDTMDAVYSVSSPTESWCTMTGWKSICGSAVR